MIRRDPEAIILAHTMDPNRIELYVEGRRDLFFLRWLVGNRKNPDATIVEIAHVNLPNIYQGGERGRLIELARILESYDHNIRFFADADFDRILNRSVPQKVWLTDHRDMEGYVLCETCLDKVIKLGLATDLITYEKLIKIVYTHGRRLGLLRLLSEINKIRLPFQDTELQRYLSYKGGKLNLNFERYLQALMQNARIKLTYKANILKSLDALDKEVTFKRIPDSELIHGKDAFCIIQKILSNYCKDRVDIPKLLWTSYELSLVKKRSALESIKRFIEIKS